VAALGALGASALLAAVASDRAERAPRATPGPVTPTPATTPGAREPAPARRGTLPPVSSRPIEHGPRTRRWVALTFDADMTRAMLAALRAGRVRAAYDERIVAQLRALRAPATVFLTGLWTQTYPEVARSLARDRLFELGNHTVDHSGFVAACYGLPGVSGEAAKRAEIGDAAATISRVTGVRVRWFRFPGGCHSAADARLVAAAGEQPVQWDVPSGDAYLRDPAAIVRQTLRDTRPGSIVVMHLNGAPNAPATSGALPAVVRGLRARHLRLVTLSRLLSAAR
jgi:peptidoglycan/xylan/chitin deacetylase (PgdA/CDA1 family)